MTNTRKKRNFDDSGSESYNRVPPPLSELELAKQKALQSAACLSAEVKDSKKRSRLDEGEGYAHDDKTGYNAGQFHQANKVDFDSGSLNGLHGSQESQKVEIPNAKTLPQLIEEFSERFGEETDILVVSEEEFPVFSFEEMAWEPTEEMEKACSDRTVVTNSIHPIFSKVYAIVNVSGCLSVAMPQDQVHESGSPSSLLRKRPTGLEVGMNAALRIRVLSSDAEGKSHTSYGTGFAVSENVVLTAMHVVSKNALIEVKACSSVYVVSQVFDTDIALKGGNVQSTKIMPGKAKDRNGLFVKGADVACFKAEGSFDTFLLPCSPKFLSSKEVVTISFPAIDHMLRQAQEELVLGTSGNTVIWKQYDSVLKPVRENTLRELAAAAGMRVAKARKDRGIMDAVDADVKKRLYHEICKTFGVSHTGGMVCSVGTMLCSNNRCIGTSCSTAIGSSGAPVIPLKLADHFVAVLKGGSKGFDMNLTTSVDNPDFVEFYKTSVLPTLPPLDDSFWTKRRADGFMHWLCLHGLHVPSASAGSEEDTLTSKTLFNAWSPT